MTSTDKLLRYVGAGTLTAAACAAILWLSFLVLAVPMWVASVLREPDIGDLESLVTIGAIFVGGWWTWRHFVRTRPNYPRADSSHFVTHARLTQGKLLIRATVNFTNKGELLIVLRSGLFRVKQLLPLLPEFKELIESGQDLPLLGKGFFEYGWKRIAEDRRLVSPIHVEPGETHQFVCDFIVPASVSRGNWHVAISTSGTDPALAKFLRQKLSAELYKVKWPIEKGKRQE